MRRYLSFRDFDWPLLGMVLTLCTISVFEIYSATLHTKYVGFHTKQLYWILGGIVAMFIMSKIDYHKLLDTGLVALRVFHAGAGGGQAVWTQGDGWKRWIKMGPISFQPSEWFKLVLIVLMALYFANLGGRRLTWPDIFKAIGLVGCRCCWC
jgi:rod shape determining protein RodA